MEVKVLLYNLNPFSQWRYTIGFEKMLVQRLSGMSHSNAKFFGLKQGNHYVINDIGSRHLLKLMQSTEKSSLEFQSQMTGLQL